MQADKSRSCAKITKAAKGVVAAILANSASMGVETDGKGMFSSMAIHFVPPNGGGLR